MRCGHGIQGVQTLGLFSFKISPSSAVCFLSEPALCRVVSPNRTHVLCSVARGEGGVAVAGVGGWGGAGCNRLVTSIVKLTLGPFPCQLSPGGDVFSA